MLLEPITSTNIPDRHAGAAGILPPPYFNNWDSQSRWTLPKNPLQDVFETGRKKAAFALPDNLAVVPDENSSWKSPFGAERPLPRLDTSPELLKP
jgi:hypothetical protein